jgi:hypothetical protein
MWVAGSIRYFPRPPFPKRRFVERFAEPDIGALEANDRKVRTIDLYAERRECRH